MATTAFDDETLMAFADGVLDDEASAAIEAAIASDPNLAARVAALAEARVAVRDLHAPLADLPVPPELAARIRAMAAAAEPPRGEVVSLAGRRRDQRRGGWAWPALIAASLAALLAGPAGYLLAVGDDRQAGLAVAEPVPAEVAALLDTLPAGAEQMIPQVGRLEAIATFRDAEGSLCREFEVDRSNAVVAVACRTDGAWRVAFAVEAPLDGGYAPAGSLAALEAWLDAVSAGEPMSPEDEAAALER